jgi:hypothetical protein
VDSIARVLIDLAENKDGLLDIYRRSPQEALDKYELTEGQKDIIKSGDLLAIRNALDYEYATGADGLPPYEPAPYPPTPPSGEQDDAPPSGGVHMVVTWRRPPRPTW